MLVDGGSGEEAAVELVSDEPVGDREEGDAREQYEAAIEEREAETDGGARPEKLACPFGLRVSLRGAHGLRR